MRRLSHRGLVLLLPAVFFISATLRAQEIPSHEIDRDLAPPKNVSKLLDPKRLKGKSANPDVEMMRDLLKFMDGKVNPNDVDPEMVQQFLRDHPEFRDPKNLEKLRDLAEKQMREPRNVQDPNARVDWQGVQNQLKRIDEARKNQPPDRFDPKEFDPMAPPPIPKEEPRPQTNMPKPKKEGRETQDFARWLSKNFGNSPETRNMAKDFAKIMGSDKNGGGGLLKDLEKEWKALGGSDRKSNSGGSNLKDIANQLKLPDSNSGGSGRGSSSSNFGSGSSGGSSSFSSSSSPGGGGGWNFGGGGNGGGSWTPLLILFMLGVGGFLFYLYFARNKKTADEAPVEKARVWPVDPLQVNSREDVVKAFEFLSISKCGEEAVNWHHLQIADRMGAKEPDHKEAADRLARLYEKARYAPANELFDAMDIAEARARFSQLAGAPVA